jgi:hypothetical protein
VYVCVYVCTHVHPYVLVLRKCCMYACMHACMSFFFCACVGQLFMKCMHACMHVLFLLCVYWPVVYEIALLLFVVFVCMGACLWVLKACTYVRIYVRIYICMFFMYVHDSVAYKIHTYMQKGMLKYMSTHYTSPCPSLYILLYMNK